MAVILDLDQTLVDSSIALQFRQQRDWQRVYSLIPEFVVFPGINEILNALYDREIQTCIVTSAPRPYCIKVVSYFEWSFSGMVCYHDTKLHKPNPEPILSALRLLNIQPHQAISVGDQAKDVIASNRAGVKSVAAIWGSHEVDAILSSKPTYVCKEALQLMEIIMARD